MIKVGILTISDKGARGEREDKSGHILSSMISQINGIVDAYEVIPDEKEIIRGKLIDYADQKRLDLILTTGGTGVSPRDVTPDATSEVIEREIPGMAEVMRIEGLKSTPFSIISRAVVGIRGGSLIVNLPGSPKGARENFEVILPSLPHAISKIKGSNEDCG